MKRWCGGGRVGGEKDNRWGGAFPRQPLICLSLGLDPSMSGGEGGRRGPQVDAVIDAAGGGAGQVLRAGREMRGPVPISDRGEASVTLLP